VVTIIRWVSRYFELVQFIIIYIILMIIHHGKNYNQTIFKEIINRFFKISIFLLAIAILRTIITIWQVAQYL